MKQLIGGGDNFNTCIAFGHCNQDGFLTRKGLISYDYKIRVDLGASTNISTPAEGFHDILIEGKSHEIGDFIEKYHNTPNKTFAIVGYRDESLNCCVAGTSGCWRAEQTNFKLDGIGIPDNISSKNLVDKPITKENNDWMASD